MHTSINGYRKESLFRMTDNRSP